MSSPSPRWSAEIAGMTCDGCGRHVARAVERAGGVDVSVSWRHGTATFAGDAIDESTLEAATGEAGYTLRSLRRLGSLEAVTANGGAEFDLAIIGSGSAAFAAAIRATEAGARVVMVEKATPGGTCVNVGCVPSKALLAAAETHRRGRRHDFAGIAHTDGTTPDLAAIVAQKDELVGALRRAKYLDLVDAYGFELRRGTARFVDADTIHADGVPLAATNYLIATGARPTLPPIEGLTGIDYLTSTTALELTQLPARLAVVGANAIGLELGQAFAHLGAEVTFLDIAGRIAPFEEPEISAALTDLLVEEGARVVTGATIKRVSQAADGAVTLEGDLAQVGSRLEADRVLIATGRAPNTAELNLAAAGVQSDRGGFVVVDEFGRTTNPRLWAAGDVTPSPQFVYVAAAQGALVADNAIGRAHRTIDYQALPRVTFTAPQDRRSRAHRSPGRRGRP